MGVPTELGLLVVSPVFRDATTEYISEAEALRQRLKRMQLHRDALAMQNATMVQGRRARGVTAARTSARLAMMEERLTRRNMEMNSVTESISSCAQELARYHALEEEGVFVSFVDLRPYTAQEQSCTKELNRWFIKQFDEGPSRLVGEEAGFGCSWVSLDDVTNRFIKGDPESVYYKRVLELQRLRSIFAASERQWVEGQVERAKQRAILATARSQAAADQAHVHQDMQSLRRRQVEIESEIYSMSTKEKKYREEVVPKLCSELARLQDTYILEGDYDLKIMRQEYYVAQQKKFINHLLSQQSRHKFLQLAGSLESKSHKNAYDLLRVIQTEIQDFASLALERIERYARLSEASVQMRSRTTFDERDVVMARLHELLTLDSLQDKQGTEAMAANVLVQKINQLRAELDLQTKELEEKLAFEKRACITDIYGMIDQMQQLLYASAATAQPQLTPQVLQDAFAELETANTDLSTAIETITKEHREKAEIVRHHPHEVTLERHVFVDFFCAPDRLRALVRDLAARVKANQVVT
ncbi:hypothetical protein CBR_g32699 [Chara braunii]|uniref:HAUS augmin-like complex subunit 3 N-terminal domain-containing protein n=1 Tax=Chara braunii TaxID=69332 RepID=A0A388LHF8_CHABU|nr:hypothetical protein CBR_g32699 [Chara braunii]|eukprot:GBG81707.1 hypothetical protein CBR_g32699 [Chara braunii]